MCEENEKCLFSCLLNLLFHMSEGCDHCSLICYWQSLGSLNILFQQLPSCSLLFFVPLTIFGHRSLLLLSPLGLCLSMEDDASDIQPVLDDPIVAPTQPYPEPPVTPPELLKAPPGLQAPVTPG